MPVFHGGCLHACVQFNHETFIFPKGYSMHICTEKEGKLKFLTAQDGKSMMQNF